MARRRRRKNPYVLARRVGGKRRRVGTRSYSSRRRGKAALSRHRSKGLQLVKVRRARRPGQVVHGRKANPPLTKIQKRALRAILRSHKKACRCARRRSRRGR